MFATGKGNASKDLMYESFLQDTGVPLSQFMKMDSEKIKSPLSDIVDAFYICKYLRYEVVI